jgi:hypothetical protein
MKNPKKQILKEILTGKATCRDLTHPGERGCIDIIFTDEFQGQTYQAEDVLREEITFPSWEALEHWYLDNGMGLAYNVGKEGEWRALTGKKTLREGAVPLQLPDNCYAIDFSTP